MAEPDKQPPKDAAPAKKTCFVIGPIGAEGSETRRNADNLFLGLIKPALDECGITFDVLRADHITNPGSITEQVINAVIDSDLVIADLSERNPNAYYELGIRHVMQKATIHMIAVGHEIPFDNKDSRAIHFDPLNLQKLVAAKAVLQEQVKSCMALGFKVSNPVTLALGAKQIRLSGDPVDVLVAAQAAALDALNGRLARLESVEADRAQRSSLTGLFDTRTPPPIDPARTLAAQQVAREFDEETLRSYRRARRLADLLDSGDKKKD